jgi:cell wall-associated NlpC family hydrolase
MKALLCGFSLLASLPGVLEAQTRVRILSPTLRVNLGPLSVRATVEGGRLAVRAGGIGAGTSRGTGTTAAAGASAARVLATGDRYVGTGYVYGGEDPSGFDCSGFVQYVFGRHGISLPRTSREQAGAGRAVGPGAGSLRPGDLMLFASTGDGVDHVAIYAGDGRILHSSASGRGVGYDDLSTDRGRWFMARHVASRRVL